MALIVVLVIMFLVWVFGRANELAETCAQQKQELQRVKQECQHLQDTLRQSEVKCQAMQKQLEQMQTEFQRLGRALRQSDAQHQTMQSRFVQLKTEILRIHNTLKQANTLQSDNVSCTSETLKHDEVQYKRRKPLQAKKQHISKADDDFLKLCEVCDIAHVEEAIKNGADVNTKNLCGYTPLMWAARNGSIELAALLLKHGARLDFKCIYGNTALMEAIEYGHAKVAELLGAK